MYNKLGILGSSGMQYITIPDEYFRNTIFEFQTVYSIANEPNGKTAPRPCKKISIPKILLPLLPMMIIDDDDPIIGRGNQ